LSPFPGHRSPFILRHSTWVASSVSLSPLPYVSGHFPRRALVFYPEAGGTHFLWNVRIHQATRCHIPE
jgi:hypothetical protein